MDYTKDIQKAILLIEKNLDSTITAKDIANSIGISEFHFQRVFKQELGISIRKYIQNRNMSRASLLLVSTEIKILDIALLSGFSSQEAFTRVFKDHYKLAPGQYRNQFKTYFRRNTIMENLDIKGWFTSGSNFERFKVSLDNTNFHSGNKSVKIQSAPEVLTKDFATIMQQINAKEFKDHRLKLSAYLKSEQITGWGGIWLRIDGEDYEQLKFDNMENRPIIGTNGWNNYSCVLDVPTNAEIISFGGLLQGKGTLWVDDFSLDIVSESVQTTDLKVGSIYPTTPINLDFDE